MFRLGLRLRRHARPRRVTRTPGRRPDRRRRAAGAVVAFALAAVAAQFAFHYPVGKLFPQVRDSHYGRKLARLRALVRTEQPRRPVVVATGSSLTELAFCPAVMPGQDGGTPGRPACYNFALSNCGVVVHLMTLRRILDDGIRPDLVLIETSPRFLYPDYNWAYDDPEAPGRKQILPRDRVQASEVPRLADLDPWPHDMRSRWRAKQYLPWWSYRRAVQLAVSPALVKPDQRVNYWNTDEWGWLLPPLGYNEAHTGYHRNGVGQKLRDYYTHFFKSPHDPRFEAAYFEMADLCRRHGVRFVMLVPPESSFIRDSCPEDGDNVFGRFLTRLRAEAGAEVVSARDWVPDDEFSDGSHVLPSGAGRYSRRLEQDVLRRAFPPDR